MPPADDQPASTTPSTSLSEPLSLLTQANIAVIGLTPTGKIITATDALVNLTGYSYTDLLGSSLTDLLPTVPAPLEALFHAPPEEKDAVTLTVPVETADGTIVTCEAYLTPSVETDDEEVAIVGTVHQQSDPITATARFPERGPDFKGGTAPVKAFVALSDAVPDGIIVLNAASQIQYANPAVERILGYSPDELVGGSKVDIIPERLRDVHLNAFQQYLETGERNLNWEYTELPGQRKNGDEVPLGVSINDFMFNGDHYFVGLFRDISQRKKIQRELEESNKRLEQFAYAASHDLQEPLRMVSSYLQLIDQRYGDEFDEDGEEFLEFALDGANRMREMIDGLLAYSRVETRGDPFGPVDLNAVVRDVQADLQLRIEETDAELLVDDLPRVAGDRSQLRQVMQNLVSNALTYSGKEQPRIEITAERDGERWQISVQDHGIGIDPADTDKIFEVFHRLHSRDEYGGTGLGLAVCQRIIERHDGKIWVDTRPGDGSIFRFTLPAVETLADS